MASKEIVEEYSYELKIPKERVAVLIGKKGETKKQLERLTNTKLQVDSIEGDVSIAGKDSLNLYTCREIIRAIGRGFNPEIAMQLLKQDYGLEIIDVSDYAKSRNDEERLKGRIIGEQGKSRRYIESLTKCSISVYGKTASIIGSFEGLSMARKAVEMLLGGATHTKVFKWLERKKKEMRHHEML